MIHMEKLSAILADNEFAAALKACKTKDDVLNLLNSKGAEVTEDEVNALIKSIKSKASNELDMDALEQVNGGSWVWDVDDWLREHSTIYKKVAEQLDDLLDGDDDE